MKNANKTVALWLSLVLIAIMMFNVYNQKATRINKIEYSDFKTALKNGEIERVTIVIEDNIIKGDYIGGKGKFSLVADTGQETQKLIEKYGVPLSFKKTPPPSFLQQVFLSWGPAILIIIIFIFLFRQIQAGGGKAMSFGKSRAKLMTKDKKKATFKDVAGIDEAKEELEEIIEFLRSPHKFTKLGGRIPKGVLLMGEPGTGKTLLARAIAGEAEVPFFTISGSEFVEMFVGVGASRVRDLFDQGKKHAPCIVFIDEIDAVGRHRGAGLGGGHDEREQTLNQLLIEMDGFESNDGVILMAATNRPDVLDPALLRPGRFDRRVVIPRPDLKGRLGILKVHGKKVKITEDMDLSQIARGTPGFSGADLENLVNEAALIAARKSKKSVESADFEDAKDKIMMGKERKAMIISDEEKKNTAYHEAGHALVGASIPGTDPIHKITIIPRGRALGLTQVLPVEDKLTMTKEYAENNIAFLLGGRVAEEVALKHQTTGAGNDFERATHIAKKMVCSWGMSSLGPVIYGRTQENVFLGKELGHEKDFSEEIASKIDQEVHHIISKNYNRAKEIIESKIDILNNIAEALLTYESLEADDIKVLLDGKTLTKESPTRKRLLSSLDEADELMRKEEEEREKLEEQRRKEEEEKRKEMESFQETLEQKVNPTGETE